MMHYDARTKRRLVTGPGEQEPLFDGKTPSLLPRGHVPPRVFLPRSCSSFPTRRGRRGTRGDNTTTTTRWRCPEALCYHHAQGIWLICSGNYPFSVMRGGCVGRGFGSVQAGAQHLQKHLGTYSPQAPARLHEGTDLSDISLVYPCKIVRNIYKHLWANAAAGDPRPSESFGSIGFLASSFERCGIFTFKMLEFHGCGRFHGFVVSRVSETIWARF